MRGDYLAKLNVMKRVCDGTCGAELMMLTMRIDGVVCGKNKFTNIPAEHWSYSDAVKASANK